MVRWRDLDLNLTAHPTSGDVVTLLDDAAVKRAVKTIVLINLREIPFRPNVGSDVHRMLFEPATAITATVLKRKIEDCITDHEPRVELISVIVTPTQGNQGFDIQIEFRIKNRSDPLTVRFPLSRIR